MTEYVSRALEQIAEIHEHLAKAEVYRGWRSVPVASSAWSGLAAAAWQSATARPLDPWSFTVYWLAVGSVALVVGCSEIVWHYVDARDARRAAAVAPGRRPVPAGAGRRRAGDAGALVRLSPSLVTLLPGLWALLFGVGGVRGAAVRAARERLGRALLLRPPGCSCSGARRASTPSHRGRSAGRLAIGQLFAAAVLYWSIERPDRIRMRALDDAPIEGRDHGEKA